MRKIPKKIKSLLPLSWIILFFLTFMFPTSLKAADCQVIFKIADTSSITEKEIESEIKSYLMSHSFYPVLSNSDINYEITHILEESGVVYVFGDLSQGEACLLALFSIEKGWFSTATDLLYMATDFPPDPLLFRDVSSLVQTALPNSLSNYHVLIQKPEDYPSGNELKAQVWTFYNLIEWIETIVLTVPTLDGGVDFSVLFPTK